MKRSIIKNSVWNLLLAFTAGSLFAGSTPSAFEARTIAEKHVPAKTQGKVIQIFGEQTTAGLYPKTWRVLFWDTTASQHGRVITVKEGVVSEIKDGFTDLEHLRLASYKEDEVINSHDLKWDSSKALDKVLQLPSLKEVKVSSVEFLLTKNSGAVQPLWRLRLFSDKAGTEVEVGQVNVSAETGEIFELKLQLEKLQ
jgi:hypothetical protein